MASVSKELTEVKGACGFDPIAALQGVYVGVNTAKSDDPVVVVNGFHRDQLEKCFGAMAEKDGEKVEVTRDGAITMVKSSDKDQAIGWINDSTMVMVPNQSDAAFLKERIAGTGGLGDNPDFSSVLGAADQSAPLWFAGHFQDGSPAADGLGKMMMGAKPLGFYGNLGFAEGLQVDVGLRFGTAEEASQLLEKVKPMLGVAKGQLGPAGKLVDKLQLAAADKDMTVKLSLSNADLEQLQQLAGPMLGAGLAQ
jgi:hypothetical protein